MKAIAAATIATTIMTILAGTGFSQNSSKKDSPLACNRTTLTPEQRKRHFDELGPALRSRRQSVHELADGYEFAYPSDTQTYQLLTEWIGGGTGLLSVL